MANILTERTGTESAVVVDTDVISMLFKRDSRAAPYINLLINLPLVSSFMTYAELYQWARFRNWGTKKNQRTGRLPSRLYNRHGIRKSLPSLG